MKYILSLRQAIDDLIKEKNAYVLGEDIQDPYGGAFKVTKGLSGRYPENIIATPMSEQGFTALGVGMALMGDYVIEEVMFGDFLTLAADQMINHAAKFYGLYGQKLHLILRVPSGAYRGYGATHSQSLEKLFLGIPGIRVVAANAYSNPGLLLKQAIGSGKPTVFVENKMDYPKELVLEGFDIFCREERNGIVRISVPDETPQWTIVTYGGVSGLCVEAARQLFYEEEITADIQIVSDLSHYGAIRDVVRTDKILIVEEGVKDFGWGCQAACILAEKARHVQCMGAADNFIPAARSAERSVLVQPEDIVSYILEKEPL